MGTPSQAAADTAAIVLARPPLGVSARQAHTERRATGRYAIDLSTTCEIRNHEGRPVRSAARVVNISSGGLLLYSEHALEKGQKIRLRIDWPALLNNVVPLALHVEGLTVRVEGKCVAVKIVKSEFRTRPVDRSVSDGRPFLGSVS